MATHSSILGWRISWTEELSGLIQLKNKHLSIAVHMLIFFAGT